MNVFIGILITALAAGLIGHLIARLTAAIIKSYRKRKTSKVVAASMKMIAQEAIRSPGAYHVNMADLDNCDSVIMEYDPYRDELVHSNRCAETDSTIARHIALGNGVAVYEDYV